MRNKTIFPHISRHALALGVHPNHLRLCLQEKRSSPKLVADYHALLEEEKELASGPGAKFLGGDQFGLDPNLSPDQEAELLKYCRRERGVFIVQRPFALTCELAAESTVTEDAPSTPKMPTKRGEIRRTKLLKGGLAALVVVQEAFHHLTARYVEIFDQLAAGKLTPAAAKAERLKLNPIDQAIRQAVRTDQPESQPDEATLDMLRAFIVATCETASAQASEVIPAAQS